MQRGRFERAAVGFQIVQLFIRFVLCARRKGWIRKPPYGGRYFSSRRFFIVRRILLFAFSLCLMASGSYFFLLCLKHPTIYGMLRGGIPALFWVCLGGFLIWDDFIRPGPSRRKSDRP
jgi:hypothetical protein